VQVITAQELNHMWDRGEDFLLVNTLPAEKFSSTKVLSSVSIPESESDFAARVVEKAGSRERAIVLYCASQACDSSSKAAQKLLDAGFEDVRVFEAGAEGWREFTKARSTSASRW
jgi:rhodanese-related sulfurtransferase